MSKIVSKTFKKARFTIEGGTIIVYNAYYIKDYLKANGYRFNPDNKTWYKKIAKSDEAREIEFLKSLGAVQ
ncbi:MAG: hypothetical protein ACP5GU_02335 [Thermoprotei archaeon]